MNHENQIQIRNILHFSVPQSSRVWQKWEPLWGCKQYMATLVTELLLSLVECFFRLKLIKYQIIRLLQVTSWLEHCIRGTLQFSRTWSGWPIYHHFRESQKKGRPLHKGKGEIFYQKIEYILNRGLNRQP